MDSNQCETFVPKEQRQIIKINARGEKFETFASKLLSIRYFQNMLGNNGQTASLPDKDGYYFIDQSKDLIYHMMAYVESGFLPTSVYAFDYLKVVFGSFGVPLEKVEEDHSIMINKYLDILTNFIKNIKTKEMCVVFIDVEHKYGIFTEIRDEVYTYSVPKLFHEICNLSCDIQKLLNVEGYRIGSDDNHLIIRKLKAKGKTQPKRYDSYSDSDQEDVSDEDDVSNDVPQVDVKAIIDKSKLEIVKIGQGVFKEDYWNPTSRIVFHKNNLVAYGVLSNDGEIKEFTPFERNLMDTHDLDYEYHDEDNDYPSELEKYSLEIVMNPLMKSNEKKDFLDVTLGNYQHINKFYVDNLQGYPLYVALFGKYLNEHDASTLMTNPNIYVFDSWINMKKSLKKLWASAFSTLERLKDDFSKMAEVSRMNNLPPESFVYFICTLTQQYLNIIFLNEEALVKALKDKGLKTEGNIHDLVDRLLLATEYKPKCITFVEWMQLSQDIKDIYREKYLYLETYFNS